MLARERGCQPVRDATALFADPEGPRNGRGDEGGIGQGAQVNEPNTIGKFVEQIGGHLQRQPRLTDSTRTGDRQQANVLPVQQVDNPRDLVLPPEKRGWLQRQIIRAGCQRPDRGNSAGISGWSNWKTRSGR